MVQQHPPAATRNTAHDSSGQRGDPALERGNTLLLAVSLVTRRESWRSTVDCTATAPPPPGWESRTLIQPWSFLQGSLPSRAHCVVFFHPILFPQYSLPKPSQAPGSWKTKPEGPAKAWPPGDQGDAFLPQPDTGRWGLAEMGEKQAHTVPLCCGGVG